jgi:hypothetical protein
MRKKRLHRRRTEALPGQRRKQLIKIMYRFITRRKKRTPVQGKQDPIKRKPL